MSQALRTTTLRIGDNDYTVSISESEPTSSRFSSRLVRRAEATLSGHDFAEVQALIEEARRVGVAVEHPGGLTWGIPSATFDLDEGPVAALRLEEFEELRASQVQFPGFSLFPKLYKEDVYDDVLLIQMMSEPIASEDDPVAELAFDRSGDEKSDYFEVVRVGVDDTPMSVRFGRVLWDNTPAGRRYLISLVSERGDNERTKYGPPQPWDPTLNRLVDAATESALRLARIERALIDSDLMREVSIDPESREYFEERTKFARVKMLLERFF